MNTSKHEEHAGRLSVCLSETGFIVLRLFSWLVSEPSSSSTLDQYPGGLASAYEVLVNFDVRAWSVAKSPATPILRLPPCKAKSSVRCLNGCHGFIPRAPLPLATVPRVHAMMRSPYWDPGEGRGAEPSRPKVPA